VSPGPRSFRLSTGVYIGRQVGRCDQFLTLHRYGWLTGIHINDVRIVERPPLFHGDIEPLLDILTVSDGLIEFAVHLGGNLCGLGRRDMALVVGQIGMTVGRDRLLHIRVVAVLPGCRVVVAADDHAFGRFALGEAGTQDDGRRQNRFKAGEAHLAGGMGHVGGARVERNHITGYIDRPGPDTVAASVP
jgi:hypothetical protein